MTGSCEGRVALVTGGGSGIGRATALIFAREGASVVVADRDVAGAHETVRLVRDLGADAHAVEADVTDESSVSAMVDAVVDRFGRLDCAHNNAGIIGARPSVPPEVPAEMATGPSASTSPASSCA